MPNTKESDVVETPAPPPTHEEIVEEHLVAIHALLTRMNRRDRWRTIGGFVRGLVQMIPIIIFIISALYFYWYGDQLLDQIIKQTTEQTMQLGTQNMDKLLQDFQKNIPSTFQTR